MDFQLASRQETLVAVHALELLGTRVDLQVDLETGMGDELGTAVVALELFLFSTFRFPVHSGRKRQLLEIHSGGG